MSSWFSLDAIRSVLPVQTDDLAEMAALARSAASEAHAAAVKVGTAAAESARTMGIDPNSEMMQKLTLRTPDMISLREEFGDEEQRKAVAREALGHWDGMLPWETRDEERTILVEECREAILKLSERGGTFEGPHELTGVAACDIVQKEEDGKGEENAEQQGGVEGEEGREGKDAEDDDKVAKEADATESAGAAASATAERSSELRFMQSKLDPLPPLLANFDLDAHVSLIVRSLAFDPNLKQMHSDLSGPGARERNFWANYFFHCAYARYVAGLSIDEIWGAPENRPELKQVTTAMSDGGSVAGGEDGAASAAGSEVVTFDDEGEVAASAVEPSSVGGTKTMAPVSGSAPIAAAGRDNDIENDEERDSSYEVVSRGESVPSPAGGGVATGEGVDNDDLNLEDDGDMDDLEAEIARELEEMEGM